MKIENKNPRDLKPHPRIKNLHRWKPKDERFLNMVAEVLEIGIKQPLQINNGHVVDGELRRLVAVKAGIDSVPTVEVPDDQVSAIICGSVCNRRHYTKGQRAFMLAGELESAFEEGLKRRAEAGKSGGINGSPVHSADVLAEKYGISARILEQARKVHKIFAEDQEYGERVEPQIFDEDKPTGLGAVIAGYGGKASTKGKARNHRQNEQLELFDDAWTTLGKRFVYWGKLQDEERVTVLPRIRSVVASMPADLRQELKKAIRQAEREEAAA